MTPEERACLIDFRDWMKQTSDLHPEDADPEGWGGECPMSLGSLRLLLRAVEAALS